MISAEEEAARRAFLTQFLLPEEREAFDAIEVACGKLRRLPEQHPSDDQDVVDAVHVLQRVVLAHVGVRVCLQLGMSMTPLQGNPDLGLAKFFGIGGAG